MSSEWMPIPLTLAKDVRLDELAFRLRVNRCWVLGVLIDLWTTAYHQAADGVFPVFRPETLDAIYGIHGLCRELAKLGWVEIDGDSLRLPRFREQFGSEARRRAMESRRKANSRSRSELPASRNPRTNPAA
ncbi:hypothetical protein [Tuwongella immobilis]|uniref:Uncharacterized protein n=1 Tax=Tuwongella immobilis TaxID=692036 RepID=A0A6C2YRI9_9BACT|nr:hypothetical protein [Tuwongella immobilis]VIP03944.1 Uncharacterized protein OS=Serratia marcescens BIDMC 80 GN=AF53_03100 PE=4 SV=1 [Tuwongella immobilis]VTS05255.1 Uncharacterized protein OS=Serratia marcescens BIDMC 80 GN=AF53_03100 PE=4 SV=1 [Tuwongella immobilis]